MVNEEESKKPKLMLEGKLLRKVHHVTDTTEKKRE
jgi:hypothetical protein